MIRIFVYRCIWNPKRNKEEPIPYEVRANLVGMRILIIRPTESKEPLGFFPLFNEYMEIVGTQLILHKKTIIDMPNIEREEWIFATEVAMSAYKIYYNQDHLDEDCLLLVSNLAEVLNASPEFTESDHSMLLKYQIRYLMNMVPFMLD